MSLCLAIGLAMGVSTNAPAQSNKPNILVIWGDDIGISTISYIHGG